MVGAPIEKTWKNQPKKNILKATATKQKITQHVEQCPVTDSTKSIPKVLAISVAGHLQKPTCKQS